MFFRVKLLWRDRLFEWVMAFAMFGFGFEIMLWPNTIQASAFHHILQIISAPRMSFFFMFFGAIRIAGLVANGNWPIYGPRFRAFGAGAAAFLWSQLGVSLALLAPLNDGVPSPGIPVYFCLAIGEIISAYRAIADARPTV